MEQGLKERLVGAAVLVLLAVVFVPMVLDGPEVPPAAVPATVAPIASGQSTFRYDLGAPLPVASDSNSLPVASAPATGTPASATPAAARAALPVEPRPSVPTAVAPPAVAPVAPAPIAWAAQVGSFSKEATAQQVAADLKAKGFKAFVMSHRDGKQTLHRVRVGPVATRAAADALAKKITAKTGQAARPVQHP